MKKFIVNCHYDLSDLERYYFETNSYQNIIGHLMDSHRNDASFLDSAIWKNYMNKFYEIFYLLENEKEKLSDFIFTEILSKEYNMTDIEKNNVSWEVLDFESGDILITILE